MFDYSGLAINDPFQNPDMSFSELNSYNKMHSSYDAMREHEFDLMERERERERELEERRKREELALEERNRIERQKMAYRGFSEMGSMMSDIGNSMSDLAYSGVGKFSF